MEQGQAQVVVFYHEWCNKIGDKVARMTNIISEFGEFQTTEIDVILVNSDGLLKGIFSTAVLLPITYLGVLLPVTLLSVIVIGIVVGVLVVDKS